VAEIAEKLQEILTGQQAAFFRISRNNRACRERSVTSPGI
jgi:hypothetical protein